MGLSAIKTVYKKVTYLQKTKQGVSCFAFQNFYQTCRIQFWQNNQLSLSENISKHYQNKLIYKELKKMLNLGGWVRHDQSKVISYLKSRYKMD